MPARQSPALKKIAQGILIACGASLATTSVLQEPLSYGLGMQNFVNGMFQATGSPGVVQAGNGYTLTGGYAEIRTPLSDVNVISFTPPNISAGCGGINMYMGSFHFINGQEFLALLRTIGQEALGYAFQLAIDAMCHQCGALLASIQKAITDMNNALHNTCQLAQGIFPANQIAGDFGNVVHNSEKVMGAISGDVSDFFSANNSANHEGTLSHIVDTFKNNIEQSFTFAGPHGNPHTQTQTTQEPQAAFLPEGNMFWKAINDSQAEGMLADLNSNASLTSGLACENAGNNACSKLMLMSLVGTEVYQPSAGSVANQDQSAEQSGSTSDTPNTPYSKQASQYAPTLTLTDLVNGTDQAHVMSCLPWTSASGTSYGAFDVPMGCEEVSTDGMTLQSMGYTGIKQHIKHMLLGGGPGNHVGLVNYMINGQNLSTAQQKFIAVIPGGITSLMHESEPDQGLIKEIAIKTMPIIVDAYATKLGQAVLTTEMSVYNGHPHVIIPNGYKSAVQNLERSIATYDTMEANSVMIMRTLTQQVQQFRTSMKAVNE